MTSYPLTCDLVLIGGGHTHALVLRHFGMSPLPGLRITVINPGPTAPYTGMLPGHVAGHYDRDALDIDLYRLARFAGGRLLIDAATGMDLESRRITLASGRTIAYDIASLDIGITSEQPEIEGFSTHGVAAKPLGTLATRWRDFIDTGGGPAVAILGGGVAGIEIALAMAHRLRHARPDAKVTVVESRDALRGVPIGAARTLRKRLRNGAIDLVERAEVTRITATEIQFADGTALPSAFTVTATGARPHHWLQETGLRLENGFVTVDKYLATSDPHVFAAGDCAHLAFAPRPKAGVYAVRAAPVLAANLTATLAGGPRRIFRPQRDYLKLISLGGKDAIGLRSGFAASGPWVWRWKDRIDRAFMHKLNDLDPMKLPAIPHRVTRGVRDELLAKPTLCGGCGAKVGADPLKAALDVLPPPPAGLTRASGDDAAILDVGGTKQILTTDHLTAFTGDPALMARIAALHAMSDVWAMAGSPVAALAHVTLPRMSPELQERTLSEIMEAAAETLSDAGAAIAGGHTTQGEALSIGFTITGRLDGQPIGLDGARPGDAILLTRPIGSGVLLAADMALRANGNDLDALFHSMTTSQANAAYLLRSAHAMTDVTGFGLAGHLHSILTASGVSAVLELDAIPLYAGALAAATSGIKSSLWSANRSAVPGAFADTPRADLLFDPQTAGGLLATVPQSEAMPLKDELTALGHRSAIIGMIISGPATLRVR